MSETLFSLFFITAILVFILILVSPLIFVYFLGSHPECQSKISAFVDSHKREILISIVILAILGYTIMGISAAKEGGFITFLKATFETFGGYFIIAIIFSLITGIFSKLKK